jgi:Tfp pilus assembly protein PilO
MPSLKRRDTILFGVTVAVILGGLLFAAVVRPQWQRRRQGLQDVRGLQLTLAKMRGDLLVKDRIEAVYAQLQPYMGQHGSDQQEISAFTRDLNDMYSKLKLKIRSMKILPITREPSYRRFSVKIEVEGASSHVLALVSAVATHPDPIRIDQFDLKAQSVTDQVQGSFAISKIVVEPLK